MFAEPLIDHQLKNGERVGHGADSNLFVEFYVKPKKNNAKSETEGRPVFDNVEMVRILLPGDKNTVVDRPAHDGDRERFARQYLNFQQKRTVVMEGTPLEAWPAIDPATVEECKVSKIFTVEQLAGLNDIQIQKLGMGFRELSKKAQAFIKFASDTALPQKQAAEIERLNSDNAELRSQVRDLAAKVEDLMKDEDKPRRGRPPKAD